MLKRIVKRREKPESETRQYVRKEVASFVTMIHTKAIM